MENVAAINQDNVAKEEKQSETSSAEHCSFECVSLSDPKSTEPTLSYFDSVVVWRSFANNFKIIKFKKNNFSTLFILFNIFIIRKNYL